MDINWGLAQHGGQNALSMFQFGSQMGQQAREREDKAKINAALGTIYGEQTQGAPVTVGANTPGGGIGGGKSAPQADPKAGAWNALFQADPRLAYQLRQQEQRQQADQREQQQAGMLSVGKMLRAAKADPSRYGQIRAAAAQNGIDISRVPETYDPAWVDQQLMFVDSMEKDGGAQISGIKRELIDAGYVDGSPELAAAMRNVISSKYASEYVDEKGNTRRRSTLNLGGAQPTAGPQPGVVEDGYRFKGGNPADPSAWEPVAQGGPQSPAAGGFRP